MTKNFPSASTYHFSSGYAVFAEENSFIQKIRNLKNEKSQTKKLEKMS